MNEYVRIGRFVATHGLSGHLILHHSLGDTKKLSALEVLFIEEARGSFLPYFIEKVSPKNENDLLVKVEGVETKEKARTLYPKDVWLKNEDFRKFVDSAAPIALLGFKIFNNKIELGEIIEVIEQPHQILCTIMYNGKEALIPVHQDSLKKIDQKNKRIDVELPDGLLDIYA